MIDSERRPLPYQRRGLRDVRFACTVGMTLPFGGCWEQRGFVGRSCTKARLATAFVSAGSANAQIPPSTVGRRHPSAPIVELRVDPCPASATALARCAVALAGSSANGAAWQRQTRSSRSHPHGLRLGWRVGCAAVHLPSDCPGHERRDYARHWVPPAHRSQTNARRVRRCGILTTRLTFFPSV